MNLEQVSHYIARPHELGPNEAPALKEMSEKHPYAAVFSLLYLTALANGKSVDLDAALQQHAYRLSDRTKLYHLVNGSISETTESTTASATVPEDKPLEKAEAVLVTAEPKTAVEEPVASAEPIVEEEIAPAETTPETAADAEILPSKEEAGPEMEKEPTHFELVTEAFTREQHFDIDTDKPDPVIVPETEPASVEAKPEEEVSSEEIPSEQPLETEGTPDPAVTPKTESTTRSFTSWLKSGSIGISETPQPEEKPAVAEPAPTEKKRVDEIIENFIKVEPSITRSKAEFFSPSRKAKESLDEEAVPVSETLAKIYAAQGNYPKAIHVYHQLMLSFPEKKSLFAVQIEILKKKITP